MLVPFIVVDLGQDNRHFLLNVKISGVPTYLIIDTGSTQTVIDNEFLQYLENTNPKEYPVFGFTASSVKVKFVNCPSLELQGGLCYRNITFGITDLSDLREMYKNETGYDVAGLLGSEFLVKNCGAMNFKRKTLTVRQQRVKRLLKNK